MTRWVTTSLRAALALWLGLTLVGPEALHDCPVHGASVHGATAGALGHAEHAPPGDPQPSDSGHCTCLGACCPVGPIAPTPAPVSGWVPTGVTQRVDAPAATDVLLPEPDHLWPFATAPPQVT